MAFEDDIHVQGVHTYGAPAVGNAAWAELYAEHVGNTHRWNIQNDPVPVFLPLAHQFPPGPFLHVGSRNNIYNGLGPGSKAVLDDPVELHYPIPPNPFWALIKVGVDLYHTHMSYESRVSVEHMLNNQ